MRYLLVTFAVCAAVACNALSGGVLRSDAPNPARATCLAEAEHAAAIAAHENCASVGWEVCAHRKRILAELRAAQDACPR